MLKLVQIKDIPDEMILEACDQFHADLRSSMRPALTPEERLSCRWPAKLILAKMDKMSDQGKIEYGVSLRTAWRVKPL